MLKKTEFEDKCVYEEWHRFRPPTPRSQLEDYKHYSHTIMPGNEYLLYNPPNPLNINQNQSSDRGVSGERVLDPLLPSRHPFKK